MGGPGGMQQQASATIVRAANPTTGNLSLTTGLTGTVEAADVVYVYAKASGDVTDVKVKAGDMVAQGQVLCEIDTEQVESAKNSLDTAKVRLDEAQNTTQAQMKMFLTRLGFNSKMVITGDVTQIDLPDGKRSGLKDAVRILRGVKDIAIFRFTEKDVVRHRLVQDIIKAYEKADRPK